MTVAETVLVSRAEFNKAESVFRSCRELEVHRVAGEEQSLGEEVLARRARAVIVGIRPYRGPLYEALASVAGARSALIARFGVGHDSIDKRLARQHNILVTNTPGALDVSVAEHALWLLGSLARQVASLDAQFRAGSFQGRTGMELRGKTLGILGLGGIGRQVAAIARFGFSMRVIAAGRSSVQQLEQREGIGFQPLRQRLGLDLYTTDLDEVLRQADVISLHLPANEQTRHCIDARALALMKRGALLINTARGSIVDEAALYDALVSEHLGGAALDVFENEAYRPVSSGKDLRTLDNVVLSPHNGSNTREANHRMAEAALNNVLNFLAGRFNDLNRVE